MLRHQREVFYSISYVNSENGGTVPTKKVYESETGWLELRGRILVCLGGKAANMHQEIKQGQMRGFNDVRGVCLAKNSCSLFSNLGESRGLLYTDFRIMVDPLQYM